MDEQILELIQQKGMVRRKDLTEKQRLSLDKLYKQGYVLRIDRGVYAAFDQYSSLIQATQVVPEGTICLLSALHFHELTTQLPSETWLAIPPNTSRSKKLPLRFVQFSGETLEAGRDFHNLHGFTVPIYKPAKTVADCFKHRSKIGLDVALEALKACWQERRCTMRELYEYAEICQVKTVMQPYLEFLTV